ncbi:hypothetical protein [Paracoccus sp. PAR01]|uniref:hypothetical protein n=1 Tax=Paracoccus sp. PAR01 TaxID=2769282 RepID=UPI00178701BB|nr:hypothetical protein [Paracoccus sp. PAR01]MBD9527263.1 hypothetical protein [Paracoccus sp. PAR01]
MTSSLVCVPAATTSLSPVGEALHRVGITSLHLQARAKMHAPQEGPAVQQQGAIARAGNDLHSNLVAMSRYCMQQLVPRIHSLMIQAETVAEAIDALAADPEPDLSAELGAIAAELDRCGIILRGHARSSLRVTGMIRMSEQRLWGVLAAELHRIEGTEGPMMRGCARIESLAFELAVALDALMEGTSDLPLQTRNRLCDILIRVTSEDGSKKISDAERVDLINFLCNGMDEIRGIIENLTDERRSLGAMSPELDKAMLIATEASAQSVMTSRLEDVFRELDGQFSVMASEYRKLARKSARPTGRQQALNRIASDARDWRAAMQALREPLSLSQGGPDPSVQLRTPPRKRPGLSSSLRA